MSSTNLDMASDEDYHSESEFYYPNETEITMRKKTSAEFKMDSMQKYILTQRTDTVRKRDYDLNVWKRFFLQVGEKRKIE